MDIVVLNYREGTVDYLKDISDNLCLDEEVRSFLIHLGYNMDEISYMSSDNIRTRELSFVNKTKHSSFVCSECRGNNVQIRGWIDPNTNEYISDCDDDECWCENCDKITTLDKVEYE